MTNSMEIDRCELQEGCTLASARLKEPESDSLSGSGGNRMRVQSALRDVYSFADWMI